MAAGHALHSYGLKLWYISSEAKDKCDTVIYAVNRTDQGMFSPPSASGTAELLYVARSSPTAKQERVASLRNSISGRAQRKQVELCQRMLESGPSPGADTAKTK